MRKPPRILVVTVVIPFMVGCMSTLAQPLPDSTARPDTVIRGVILRTSGSVERIEYSEMAFVEWTDSTVVILGIVRGESRDLTQRTYRLSDVEAILVRQLDANRTSLIVTAVMVGIGVLGAVLFTGKTNSETVFPGGGGP